MCRCAKKFAEIVRNESSIADKNSLAAHSASKFKVSTHSICLLYNFRTFNAFLNKNFRLYLLTFRLGLQDLSRILQETDKIIRNFSVLSLEILQW